MSKDPLECELKGYNLFGDVEALEMVHIMDLASIITWMTKFEPLNR